MFDLDTSSSKTSLASSPKGLATSSVIWPSAGMMRNGRCYPQPSLERRTSGEGSGLWPTPRHGKTTSEEGETWLKRKQDGKVSTPPLSLAVKMWPTPSSHNKTGGATGLAGGSGNRLKLYKMLGEEEGKKLGCQSLNPYWVEWLMGFPLGWTVCEDSATPASRKSSNGSDDKS